MKVVVVVGCTLLLAACGGSQSSAPSRTVTPPVTAPTNTTWQAGVFANDLVFKNRCAAPRTGFDINGNAFPDAAGTSFDEKMWLRSWSNDTYLWYDEIADQNPDNFTSPSAYFSVLKTEQNTSSGVPKDNFHFLQSTEEFESFAQSGTQAGYGINWSFENNRPPRSLRVSTVEPNSSASDAGVRRGDQLILINGIDFVNTGQVDAINAALFPQDSNVQTSFVFQRNDGSEVSVSLTSGDFATSFVNNTQVIDTQAGRVGYVRFDGFQRPAQTPLIDAFQRFVDENVTELVLDMRYNGGGLLAMASQLGYMIAGPNQTNNASFETQRFNDKYPNIDPVTGNVIQPTPFYNREIDFQAGVFTSRVLPNLGLTRVYVITTDGTCSASEALINGLRGINVEVVQIGGTTCGKPYGFYPTDNCGTTFFTIQFQTVNAKGFGEYANGFKPRASAQFADELPGCSANDDFSNPLGNEQEEMLQTALYRLNEGSCPVATTQSSAKTSNVAIQTNQDQDPSLNVFDPRYRSLLLENSINTPIRERGND